MDTAPTLSTQRVQSAFRPTSARKLRTVITLFVFIFLSFLALDDFRIRTLEGIRAYVEGEGLWSKGQKESVLALRRYSRSMNEADFQEYVAAIAVPLGDHEARLELEKPSPDLEIVYRGFLEGGNHPDDLSAMATLFRRFRHISYMSDAISTWTQGDADIALLQDAASALHTEITSGRKDPATIEALVRRIDAIDHHLTPLENQFSDQMTAGSLMMSYALSLVVFGAAGLLLAAGVAYSMVLARKIQASETSLDRANETLQESEQRFRSLIQDVSDVILEVAADGTVYYASHSAGRIFGYAPEDMTAQNLCTLIHPEDQVAFRNRLEASAVQENGAFTTEFRLGRKDGAWITREATANPMSGSPSSRRTLLTCRDVTERRRLELELGQSQKMEAVGRLAGGIAHDFNNILMIIGGYSEIVADQLHPEDPMRNSAAAIVKTVERGKALTKRLLSFSRKQVMSPRNLDLKLFLEDMSKVLPRLLGEEIEIAIKTGNGVGTIYTDAAQLEQVLINLAVNSRDAMPRGGKLTIATENMEFDDSRSSEQSFIVPGSYVLLSISDTGCGMSSETKSHLFEPFFTTKEHGKGTGLGLSIVYGIVKRSGGYVLVDSELNAGTTVKLYFPQVATVSEITPSVPGKQEIANGSGVVLVVEDEELLRSMICEFLRGSGYAVLEAGSAAEATAAIAKFGKPVDLLLTDVILPKTRGPELARKLLEQHPNLRVIYMSGYTGTSLVRDGVLDTGTVLIQKPFKLQELSRAVRESLAGVQV